MKYPVAIHKDQDSCFGVSVPDLPGCFSAGETLDEALRNTKEAISDYLAILAEDDVVAPPPSEISNHFNDPDYVEATWAVVDVDTAAYLGGTVKTFLND